MFFVHNRVSDIEQIKERLNRIVPEASVVVGHGQMPEGRLEQVMKDEKLYLQNDLRLDDLAEKLNLSRNHTSQIINQFFNLSFFDYVNRYRVQEALDFLVDKSQDHTISQIAFDSGFNNRASFYKAFKKFADHSPTYYLEHNKAS